MVKAGSPQIIRLARPTLDRLHTARSLDAMLERAATDAGLPERDAALEMAADALLSMDDSGEPVEAGPRRPSDLETEANDDEDEDDDEDDDPPIDIIEDLPDDFEFDDDVFDDEEPELVTVGYREGKVYPASLAAWKPRLLSYVYGIYDRQPDSFIVQRQGRGYTSRIFHQNGYGKLPRFTMKVYDSGEAVVSEVEATMYRGWFDDDEDEDE